MATRETEKAWLSFQAMLPRGLHLCPPSACRVEGQGPGWAQRLCLGAVGTFG